MCEGSDRLLREDSMKRALEAPFEEVAEFHGHVCPGLAIGYVMARGGLRALSDERAADEEVVAIVENDACGVDAVQYLTGCTFGKGNLIFRDHGKQAYTFYHRASGRAVRVTPSPASDSRKGGPSTAESREERTQWILSAPEGEVVTVREVSIPAPEHARIRASVPCEFCGEKVMESRARIHEGKVACIPCAEGG